jgi:hypothetical protein
MHMTNIARRIGSLLACALVIIATGGTVTTQASAAPHRPAASVCHTGYRGQPAYDAHCLVTGTPRAAAAHWASIPTGTKGHEHDNMTTQRNICKYGHRHGSIAAWTTEAVGDVTYDHYRNNRQVNTWIGQDATLTCAQLGYRI